MDYNMLTDGTPTTKPQAQWVCNTITSAATIGIYSDPPPAPPANSLTLFVTKSGRLSSINSSGTIVQYSTGSLEEDQIPVKSGEMKED